MPRKEFKKTRYIVMRVQMEGDVKEFAHVVGGRVRTIEGVDLCECAEVDSLWDSQQAEIDKANSFGPRNEDGTPVQPQG